MYFDVECVCVCVRYVGGVYRGCCAVVRHEHVAEVAAAQPAERCSAELHAPRVQQQHSMWATMPLMLAACCSQVV
jgi:hypothetical protein